MTVRTLTMGLVAAIGASTVSALLTAQTPAPRDLPAAPATGTAAIAGRVVIDENGRSTPARHARVSLTGGAGPRGGRGDPRTFLTSESGAFHFVNLPAGQYALSFSKDAYVTIPYGAKRPGQPTTPIRVAEGQQLPDITLHLLHGAVIAGTVLDQQGQPAVGATVGVLQYANVGGERGLRNTGGPTQTDDRGAYRIFGLAPGDYVVGVDPRLPNGPSNSELRMVANADLQEALQRVAAGTSTPRPSPGLAQPGVQPTVVLAQVADPNAPPRPDTGRPVGYTTVYYPGVTTQAAAATLALAAGEERTGVDFSIQLVPTARIDGVVDGPEEIVRPGQRGGPRPIISLSSTSVAGTRTMSAQLDMNGKFSFLNVAPGDYVVNVRVMGAPAPAAGRGGSPQPARTTLWAMANVSVNGDPVDVTLSLEPAMTMTGHMVFDVTTVPPPAPLTAMRTTLSRVPTPGSPGQPSPPGPAQVDAQGAFTIAGVTPGRFRFIASAPPGDHQWWARSAVLNGKDLMDAPFEIKPGDALTDVVVTYSDRPTLLTGTLHDPAGNPFSYTVIVFSADRRHWVPSSRRVTEQRPSVDGVFTFRNLPAGEYLMAVLTDVDANTIYDGDLLTALAKAAVAISLKEGAQTTQDLTIGGGRRE